MQNFQFNSTRSLVVEKGGSRLLGERLKHSGYRRTLVVTDKVIVSTGLIQPALDNCQMNNIETIVFSDVQPDPHESIVSQATQIAIEHDVDCVVGFGGGSSMDVAKLAALLARSGEKLEQIYGVNITKGPRLPLIMVPTTAGTGSEVTPISIVTTGDGEKKGVVSSFLIPELALLDAQLTLGLPQHVSAATGIDAMVHAIEAYTSKNLKNPMSDCLAKEALRLLSGSLHSVCQNGNDLESRENMLLGACLAGMAFANAPVAAVHALAYPIGARFHVSHGLSNALILGPVASFNLEQAKAQYAELATIVLPSQRGSQLELAEAFVSYLSGLSASCGLPTRLRDVGISSADIDRLAEDAMKQTRLLINNPKEVTLKDAKCIYMEVL